MPPAPQYPPHSIPSQAARNTYPPLAVNVTCPFRHIVATGGVTYATGGACTSTCTLPPAAVAQPKVSVTTSLTVYNPATVYTCVAVESAAPAPPRAPRAAHAATRTHRPIPKIPGIPLHPLHRPRQTKYPPAPDTPPPPQAPPTPPPAPAQSPNPSSPASPPPHSPPSATHNKFPAAHTHDWDWPHSPPSPHPRNSITATA
jgi:hypothetical protein